MKKKIKMYDIEGCPIRNILSHIGDKWSLLILLVLRDHEVLRFNEIHQCIGDISQKMLSVTLKSLEADGLVTRKVYPEIPPRVEYRITPLGESLQTHFDGLAAWSMQNMDTILKNRAHYNHAN